MRFSFIYLSMNEVHGKIISLHPGGGFLFRNVLTLGWQMALTFIFSSAPMPHSHPTLTNCFKWLIWVRASTVWKLPWDKDPLMDSWLTSWLSVAIQGRLKGHGMRGTLAAINLLLPSPSSFLLHTGWFIKGHLQCLISEILASKPGFISQREKY